MLAALPAVLGGWTTQRLVREARTRAAAESVQLRLARVDTILEQAARDVRSSLGRLASSLERNETTRLSALAAGGAAVVEEAARLGAGTDLDLLTVLDAEERVISSWHWPQLAGLGARSLAGLDAARGVVRRVEGPRRARPAIVARYPLGGGRLSVVGGRWIDERIVEAVASGRGAWLVDLDPRGAGKLEFGRVPSIEAEARGVISAADAPRGPILAGRWAVGRFDLRDDRGPLGAALYIAVPLEPDRFVAGAVAAVGALAILLAALVGVWTARRISRPVDRLVQAVDAIAAGEADYALPGLVDDQFERLAAAFSRLQRSLERQQRRAAAAERIAAWREAARRVAHEVKNPLAPIRLTVENLQRAREGHPELFDELFREGTRTILDEVEQLRRLVTEFSEFARLPAPRPRAVDVHELIEGVLELHAAEPGLEIVRAFRRRSRSAPPRPDQRRGQRDRGHARRGGSAPAGALDRARGWYGRDRRLRQRGGDPAGAGGQGVRAVRHDQGGWDRAGHGGGGAHRLRARR
jgi:signal transduction histidine kinase